MPRNHYLHTTIVSIFIKKQKIELFNKKEDHKNSNLTYEAASSRVNSTIHTDEGIIGLGETNAKPAPVEEMIHTLCADLLLGQDPLNIEKIWSDFYRTFNHHGCIGTEMRALSAIDIGLWDILGKASGQPIYRLLGGASREKIKVYNTCVRLLRE